MKKLYVVVRDDLSPSQKAVQAGHAVAEWLLKSKVSKDWANGILVYLKVNNSISLRNLMYRLYDKDVNFTIFREPDIDNEATAIACLGSNKMFKNLRML